MGGSMQQGNGWTSVKKRWCAVGFINAHCLRNTCTHPCKLYAQAARHRAR